jgi:soluble lytic murein transglycosylase-like protein
MSGPAGLAAIAGRIQEISRPPAAVAAIQSRFASLVAHAAAASEAAEAPTVAAPGAPTSTPIPSGTTVTAPTTATTTTTVDGSTVSVPAATGTAPTSTTSATGTLTVPTGTTTISGVWAERVPNARGQALVPAIAETAARYGLDPAFLAAVFWTESSYTPDVVSPTGAIGLGQLMPETANWLGVDPWDPMENMDGAARLYRYYLDKYNGDIELSISAYAAGPGAVANAGGIPDEFTANYIAKLLGRRDYLNGLRDDAP